MRFISKIILLSGLLFSALLSSVNVDECKNDLYYANGIMIDMNVTIYTHEEQWINKVDEIFLENPKEFDKLANIKISYNASQGFFSDIFESAEQVMSNEWGWESFSGYFRTYLELKGYQDSVDQHRPDLDTQVKAYKQSIKDGHGVIVIAHSQGNYYTNEAYDELDEWMKDYFHMFGVATPANHVAGYAVDDASAPYVKFHNDMINFIVTSLPSNRDSTKFHGFPSLDAHDFYESYLKDVNTKDNIFSFILNQIQAHGNAPSQWETESEYEKGTKEYRINVKHRFDTSIENIENVYPFDTSKKLYQIAGEYVKASSGGIEILETWTDQKDNQFYKLEGTKPIEYLEFEIIDEYLSYDLVLVSSEIILGPIWVEPFPNPNHIHYHLQGFTLPQYLYRDFSPPSWGNNILEDILNGSINEDDIFSLGGESYNYFTEVSIPISSQELKNVKFVNSSSGDFIGTVTVSKGCKNNYPLGDSILGCGGEHIELLGLYNGQDYSSANIISYHENKVFSLFGVK